MSVSTSPNVTISQGVQEFLREKQSGDGVSDDLRANPGILSGNPLRRGRTSGGPR